MKSLRDSTRKMILEHLSRGVPEAEARFERKSGRFLAGNGGWAVTNQDIIYPLAVLYKTPGTGCYRSRKILDLALRGGDALRNWQDSEGRFEFIKIDGSKWGKTYMPWSMYHWVEAYRILRDDMTAARRTRWERGLTLAFDGSSRELVQHRSTHNIPTWHGMALVRAGQALQRDDWFRVGKEQILRSAAAQSAEGYWGEGYGPTTSYNLVYVHALGLYHHFTSDKAVLRGLSRSVDFHLKFTYPDGSCVETVDGRVKYHPRVITTGLPGFAVFPQGRTFVSFLVRNLARNAPGGALIPHLASAWEHFPDKDFAEIPQHKKNFVSLHHNKALVQKRGPWFLCMSGYVTGKKHAAELSRNRWIMDRQHYLGVFHDRLGVIVGGGNSKHHPQFCTFEYWKDGAAHFQADRIVVKTSGEKEVVLQACYGRDVCELRVRFLDERSIKLVFRRLGRRVSPGTTVRGGFLMRLRPGTRLSWTRAGKASKVDPLTVLQISWGPGKEKRTVACGDWRLTMPRNSSLEWPVYPFNPYAINDAAPPEEAVAVVSADLTKSRGPQPFLLTVK